MKVMIKKNKITKHKRLPVLNKSKSSGNVNDSQANNNSLLEKPKMALARITARQRDILKIHCIVQGISMTQLIENVLEKFITEKDLAKYELSSIKQL